VTFRPYLHVEKFGNTEVEGIELGQVYIFPKLDGTNSSVWKAKPSDGPRPINAGSRTRLLSLENDNQGFMASLYNKGEPLPVLLEFFNQVPNLRLYGEWLVPHSFRGYREDAWRKFYVFDVFNDKTDDYLSYEAYKPLLDEFGLDYIPPLATIRSGRYEDFMAFLAKNMYLCPDGGEPGEGIVLKNYDYYNQYGRQTWAKIIRNEFKDLHHKIMGAPDINMALLVEDRIVKSVVTEALVDKTVAKIRADKGWSSKNIPELFERIFYDLVKEELWDRWKENKFGTINGKTLKALTIQKIKQLRPELF